MTCTTSEKNNTSTEKNPTEHVDIKRVKSRLVSLETGVTEVDEDSGKDDVPLSYKIAAILLVSTISFAGNWGAGITGAMKTPLKMNLHIDNVKFSLLDATSDFTKAALILFAGVITDRIGGAKGILYGNVISTVGAILLATAVTMRSFKFIIGSEVIKAIGSVATQVAQYKAFSSWFPPNHGFATTLGIELGFGRIGGLAGKATANIITRNMGSFSWPYWISLAFHVLTNGITLGFFFFTNHCHRKFKGLVDPATGEVLKEHNDSFEFRKLLEFSWTYWGIMLYSLFETDTINVFLTNATEMGEVRFHTGSIDAGIYAALMQYGSFFLNPAAGFIVDRWGNRLTLNLLCAAGIFVSMALTNFITSAMGTAIAYGICGITYTIGPIVIIDGMRTALWHQEFFGSAYALKIMMNSSTNIIVRIVAGRLQDLSPKSNPYQKVTLLYIADSCGAWVVAFTMLVIFVYAKYTPRLHSSLYVDIGKMQWTRADRITNSELMQKRRELIGNFDAAPQVGEARRLPTEIDLAREREFNQARKFSRGAFITLIVLAASGAATYLWGVTTQNTG